MTFGNACSASERCQRTTSTFSRCMGTTHTTSTCDDDKREGGRTKLDKNSSKTRRHYYGRWLHRNKAASRDSTTLSVADREMLHCCLWIHIGDLFGAHPCGVGRSPPDCALRGQSMPSVIYQQWGFEDTITGRVRSWESFHSRRNVTTRGKRLPDTTLRRAFIGGVMHILCFLRTVIAGAPILMLESIGGA